MMKFLSRVKYRDHLKVCVNQRNRDDKRMCFLLEITRQEDPALSYYREQKFKLYSVDAYGNKYTETSLNLKDVQLEGEQFLILGEIILKLGNEMSSGIIIK